MTTIVVIIALVYLGIGSTALAFMLERPESMVPTPSWWECVGIVLLAPPLIAWSLLRGERV